MSARARFSAALWVAMLGLACACPQPVFAQDYDMSFTLPTAGKSGCMVCHADRNLGVLQGREWTSFWVDPEPLDSGPHADIMCTGCHMDFAYTAPHNIAQSDWKRTARLACKNCHQDQWAAYSAGSHSIAVQPASAEATASREASGATEVVRTASAVDDSGKPLCGDCHGGHGIQALTDNEDGARDLHRRGKEICGRCHEEYWENYEDYYHGAAYREGAADAPACWDCHGYHDVLPADNRTSPVHTSNLEETCAACHRQINEEYVSYAGLVHERQNAYTGNPVYAVIRQTQDSIRELLKEIGSWFT